MFRERHKDKKIWPAQVRERSLAGSYRTREREKFGRFKLEREKVLTETLRYFRFCQYLGEVEVIWFFN